MLLSNYCCELFLDLDVTENMQDDLLSNVGFLCCVSFGRVLFILDHCAGI